MKRNLFLSILVLVSITVFGQKSVQRVSVLEQFTTENCGYCPGVLSIIEDHLDNNPNFVIMSHHSGFGTDWLTIPENTAHLEFYNSSTFAPAGMIDRHYNGLDNDDYNGVDPGPVFWDGESYGTDRIDERTAIPAYTTVDIYGTNTANSYNLTVTGKFLSGIEQPIGVSLWITEDNILEHNQSGTSIATTWYHRFTVRDAISSRLGDLITTPHNTDDTYSMSYNFDIIETWDIDNLYLVAMVNDMDDENVNNRVIHNAKQVKLTELLSGPTSMFEIKSKIQISPNPTKDIFTISNAENSDVKVYNLLGKLVLSLDHISSKQIINLSKLQEGTYFINITNKNTIETQKIVISK